MPVCEVQRDAVWLQTNQEAITEQLVKKAEAEPPPPKDEL